MTKLQSTAVSVGNASGAPAVDTTPPREGTSGIPYVGRAHRARFGEALADFTGRHRRAVIGIWLALLLVSSGSAIWLMSALSGEGWDVPGSGTVAVRNELRHGFVGRGETSALLVVTDRDRRAGTPGFVARVQGVYRVVAHDRRLKVSSAYGWSTLSRSARASFLAKDRRTAITSVGLGLSNDAATKTLPSVQSDLASRFGHRGLKVSLLSMQAFQGAANRESVIGLVKGEAVAFPLLGIVLAVLFGSLMAVALAMATAMTAVTVALGIFGPIAHYAELSIFLENIVLMLGLGLGVDYSVLMIKRFKEELGRGCAVDEAVRRTMRTAGATVMASGLTVVVVSSTLFIVRLDAIVSLAAGAAVVAMVALLSALLVLPALLHVFGDRINAGRVPIPQRFQIAEPTEGESLTQHRWYRLAMRVMERPLLSLLVSGAVLVALAIPAFSMKLMLPDTRLLASDAPVRTGTNQVAQQFGVGYPSPIQAVVTLDRPLPNRTGERDLQRFVARVSSLPNVASANSGLGVLEQVSPRHPWAALTRRLPRDAEAGLRHFISTDNRRFVVEVNSAHGMTNDATVRLLRRVRAIAAQLPAPLHAAVGGNTARQVDVTTEINHKVGWVFGLMLAAVYLVLLFSFGSVFLPLKAIAMNALSFGATFGVLVMVFQYGWGANWFGFTDLGFQIAFVPLLLAAIVVALSTDYEVFLLSRVKEEYELTGDNRRAVARGLARTAPLITGAAVLMIVVFAGFGFAGVAAIQELGIGLAVAVALDATLVRSIVVPAAMRLMGRWNWWRPTMSGAPGIALTAEHGRDRI